jgi:hypothetical protein
MRQVTYSIPRVTSVLASVDFARVRHARARVTPLECCNVGLELREGRGPVQRTCVCDSLSRMTVAAFGLGRMVLWRIPHAPARVRHL